MKRYARFALVGLSLAILSITAGSCIRVVIPEPEQGASKPVINSFVADPNNIIPGTSSMLSWSVSNATRVSIDQDIGSVSLTGSTPVSPSTTTTYILTATNASGSVTAIAQVLVSGTPSSSTPPGLPIVNSFTATPPVIPAGSSTSLSWAVSNATSVYISPMVGAVGISGSGSVSPTTTTDYTLTASNAAGTTVATTQVVVSAASSSPTPAGLPIVNSFIANPETIVAGGSSTLSWSVSNAYEVFINPAVYRQLGPIAATGSAPVSPSVTTTYTLTATNSAGIRSETVTVTVIPEPGDSPTLNWAGTWETNYGIMHLSQTGSQVTGTYEHDNGKIEGNVSGSTLTGTWSESPSYAPPDDAGDVELTMSPDLSSFTGQWRYGFSGDWDGPWSGAR